MTLGFVMAACTFALVVGCAVACVDRWREARLAAVRPRLASRVTGTVPHLARRRAA